MKVVLLDATLSAELTVYRAAKGCYSSLASANIYKGDIPKFIKGIIDSGHLSVLEHASFTFSIEGISRACSHQLVRHRVASYSQQSQRYVEFAKGKDENFKAEDFFVCPPSIESIGGKQKFYADCCAMYDFYNIWVDELLEAGLTPEQSQEDARFLLPNAAKTNITMTMNARELRHFFEQRICKRAQWEIRELAIEIRRIAIEVAPNLFYNTGASCMYGPCKEGKHTCGEPYDLQV